MIEDRDAARLSREGGETMRRSMVWTAVGVLVLVTLVWAFEAWARAGGGRSMGSRGSRSYSAPVSPGPSPAAPSRQALPPSGFQQPGPQRSGWMSGLMGGIGGFLLGGLLGSLLFGGMGHGLFGGIGLLELLIVAGLIYVAVSFMRRRQQPAPAASYGSTPPYDESSAWRSASGSTATLEAPAVATGLERGLDHIRQMDHTFDPTRFVDAAADIFFKIQAAWMGRDMASVRHLLTPEMYENLQKECERLRAEHRLNRLENLAIRAVQVTEAWQEGGRDFVTAHILASGLDYTVDEATGQVVEGSRTEPVKFEEYWTFVRPVGPNAWQLSAIQQAA
jgi:predicted lipid-binding transport protein (Tim44 family)